MQQPTLVKARWGGKKQKWKKKYSNFPLPRKTWHFPFYQNHEKAFTTQPCKYIGADALNSTAWSNNPSQEEVRGVGSDLNPAQASVMTRSHEHASGFRGRQRTKHTANRWPLSTRRPEATVRPRRKWETGEGRRENAVPQMSLDISRCLSHSSTFCVVGTSRTSTTMEKTESVHDCCWPALAC